MSLFSIWPRFGFFENPYDNEGLPGNDTGHQLLVGRDAEIAAVQRGIASAGTHPSVEGPAGIGKTSMLAVTGYRMQLASLEATDGTLFIPARRFFQAKESQEEFEVEVWREVAQTLIDNAEAFRQVALQVPDIEGLDKWLNSPQYRSGSGQIAGFGGGGGSEPNVSEGFTQSGFPGAVRAELARLFPTDAAGAVICVLDNLELLQTSQRAREVLEFLRDRVFDVQGLRWVLCGARGIVSRARSDRLSGFFAAPLKIDPLPHDDSLELIRRRIDFFGGPEARPPVPPDAFEFLYRALNRNLRDALAHAQQFSDWVYTEYIAAEKELPPEEGLRADLETWLTYQAEEAEATATGIQPRVWQFFDDLAADGGRCRASDDDKFNFTTQQQMGTAVTQLANVNLLIREVDPENATRGIHSITATGWLVYFHRNGYQFPD